MNYNRWASLKFSGRLEYFSNNNEKCWVDEQIAVESKLAFYSDDIEKNITPKNKGKV